MALTNLRQSSYKSPPLVFVQENSVTNEHRILEGEKRMRKKRAIQKFWKGFNDFHKYAFIKPLRWQRGNWKDGKCFIYIIFIFLRNESLSWESSNLVQVPCYQNGVDAGEISFHQSECALLLLSTVIIWGLYLHFMECRTLSHQLWDGQWTLLCKYSVPANWKPGVSFALNVWDLLLHPRCFKDDSAESPFGTGVCFNNESNGHLSLGCLHLVLLASLR